MSLTVKAYLKSSGTNQEEIRRFAVDLDVSSSYDYLSRKVVQVFPRLANKTFVLHWKDAEGDTIRFSSDEELVEALGYVNNGIFKVYIEETGATASGENQSGNTFRPFHPGVTCDGCEGPIHGTRYKCNVCPDYDLCSGCKDKGIHTEHEMASIHFPRRAFGFPPFMPDHGFGFTPGENFMPGPPPPPYPMPPFSGPYGYGPGGFCPGGRPAYGGDPKEMHRCMKRMWKRWYRQTYGRDSCKAERKKKKEMKRKEQMEKAAESEKTQSKPEKTSSSSSSDEEPSPSEDYLKNVGQSVAAMLDPLGIDVQVDVEHNGHRRRCGPGFGAWHFGMRGGGHHPGWRRRSGFGWPQWSGGCPMGNRWNQTGTNPNENANKPQSEKPKERSAPAEANQMDTNSETGEVTNPAAAKKSAEHEGDWTFVRTNREADVEGATNGVEKISVSGQPPAATVPGVPEQISFAVTRMIEMGFNDNDGWLTRLIGECEGDINRALEIIREKQSTINQ